MPFPGSLQILPVPEHCVVTADNCEVAHLKVGLPGVQSHV